MMTAMRQARVDPVVFAALMLGAAAAAVPLAKVHRRLQRHLDRQRLALVELPRDHGKTTQVCLRLLWELGRNPNLRIKIVCASEAIANDRSRFLRWNIERNATLQAVFPHLKPSYPWTAPAFSVQRSLNILGPSVAAFGIGAASTGTRADLLVCDDVVDVKAIHSAADRDRVSDDFFNNLLNLLEPDGRFWGLCTPWHADDLNARLKKNPSFKLFRKAIGKNLEPVWPEKWPTTALQQRRDEIGAAAFARGYRLTPLAEDELVIRPEWVQYYDALPAKFDMILMSVDPATSAKATADRSAIVVLGISGNVMHCLAIHAARVTMPGLIAILEAMNATWQPDAILFETNGAFAAVKDLLVRHAGFGPKVHGVSQSNSKMARAMALAVSIQNGTVLLKNDGSQQDLYDELTAYPFGEHDDLLDALGTAVNYLMRTPREPRAWIW